MLKFGCYRDDLSNGEVPHRGQNVLLELGETVGLRQASHCHSSACRFGAAWLFAAAFFEIGLGVHHDLAAKHPDRGAVLLVTASLDFDGHLPSTVLSP